MPHPSTGVSMDLAIVNAARTSYMGESKGRDADERLLRYLVKHHHTSPLEMVNFKFRVRAPVVTFWHWVRHRSFQFMSVNSQSGRYTPFDENEFYTPDVWRLQAKDNKQASDGVLGDSDNALFNTLYAEHTAQGYALYNQALDAGISREMARLFLPAFGVYYTWVISTNGLALTNFLRLRRGTDAQYEIRAYADVIYSKFLKPLAPILTDALEQEGLL